MDRRRAAGVLLALAACVAYATAAPTASNHTSLDLYDGAPDGCYYNFQHYGEGDRIMTNEPCLNCTCHNRMLMCYLRVCPFTKPIGQDCTIEKRADQCCPIVTCPDVPVDLLTSTTTSPAEYGASGLGKLDKYGCSIHGKYFSEGSKVPPTPNKPCEHCYCIRNMTTCVMQECTLHVDGCTPIYHKDVCCPVRYSCDHPEDEMPLLDDLSTTVRPTPGFVLTTTTLSPVTQMSQECLYENKIIPDGALIKTEKACDHCYCMKGDIVCVVQECGTPMENEGKNCTALPPREGVCCPDTYICEGDESTTGTYEGQYFTTELYQEKLTTQTPPRRAGSEGSGYRIEPDDIHNTESPYVSETEGSGDEQATVHPTVVSEIYPDSHKMEPTTETVSSTEEAHEFIPIISTVEPYSEYDELTTVKEEKQSAPEEHVTSSLNDSIPKEGESTTTKAFDEDIGSGEEEISAPQEIVPTPSVLPVIEDSEPTVANKQDIATTESGTEDYFVKEGTTNAPIVEKENKVSSPNDQNSDTDISVETTTQSRRYLDEEDGTKKPSIFDEEAFKTERDSLQTTTIVPVDESDKRKTTEEVEQESTTLYETDSKETLNPEHYFTESTSVPVFEDEIVTESQDIMTDGIEGSEGSTSTDIDLNHHNTVTASTPLLEEIEKETTEQENVPHDNHSDDYTTSTTQSNIPIETIDKNDLKPDSIDETISTNIPNTVSKLENDNIPTTESQKDHDKDKKESSEPQDQSFTSHLEDEIINTTQTDIVEESSDSQEYTPITTHSPYEEEIKKTTETDSLINNVSEGQTDDDIHHTDLSIATTLQQNEITTAEPDKGLNTIPSGAVDDETTESPEQEKITPADDKLISLELTTELENKFNDDIVTVADTSTHTTLVKETSRPSEDQFDLTTESAKKEIDDSKSTTVHEITEPTTRSADIAESTVAHDHSSSTEAAINHQESPAVTETIDNIKQITDSTEPSFTTSYESITEATSDADSTPSKQETLSYETISESTTANLEENEIVNEPRIPGEGDCLLNGVTYRNESIVPNTNKCQSGCRCVSSIIKCDPIICSPPPKYMDNCHATYDSPNSCCPTYVCDHKTETMPPQSHSQVSGTEAPEMPPFKCQGDECVINEDKIPSIEITELCESGKCPSHGETDYSLPPHIPEQPVVDKHKECTGEKCTPITDQMCDGEKGCQAAPVKPCEENECGNVSPTELEPCADGDNCDVPIKECNGKECRSDSEISQEKPHDKPCEGNECRIISDSIPPHQLQPCADGENCEVPVKECNGEDCSSGTDIIDKKPHDKICDSNEDCETKHDIEKECTEKSCKRKGDSGVNQHEPSICSGSECQSTEITSELELTTVSTALSQKESDLESDIKTTDNIDIMTENPTKLPSQDSDQSTKLIENVTEEPEQDEIVHSDTDSKIKPEYSTTTSSEITTKLPELETVNESATASEETANTDASPLPHLPESNNLDEENYETEPPTHLTSIHVTDKQGDIVTSDLSYNNQQTTEKPGEFITIPSGSLEQQEVTKPIHEQTGPIKTHDIKLPEEEIIEDATSISEEMFTESPKTPYTVTSEAFKPTENEELEDSTSKIFDTMSTLPSGHLSTEPQDMTPAPIGYNQNEGVTSMLPQGTDSNKSPTERTDAETSKPVGTDLQGITPKESESGITEIVTKSEDIDVQEVTKSPQEISSEEKQEEQQTESSESHNTEYTESSDVAVTTTKEIADKSVTESSQPSETSQDVTLSQQEIEKDVTTSKNVVETDAPSYKPDAVGPLESSKSPDDLESDLHLFEKNTTPQSADINDIVTEQYSPTVNPLEIATKQVEHIDVTGSSDMDEHISAVIPDIQNIEIPSTTEEQGNTKTEVPFLHETKGDTTYVSSTLKPSDITDVSYSVDKATEYLETIASPGEESTETLDTTKQPPEEHHFFPEKTSIPVSISTEKPYAESETKLPIHSDTSNTDGPATDKHEFSPTEPADTYIDKTETPEYENKFTNNLPERQTEIPDRDELSITVPEDEVNISEKPIQEAHDHPVDNQQEFEAPVSDNLMTTIPEDIVKISEKPTNVAQEPETPARDNLSTEAPEDEYKVTHKPADEAQEPEAPGSNNLSTGAPEDVDEITEKPAEKFQESEESVSDNESTKAPIDEVKFTERPAEDMQESETPVSDHLNTINPEDNVEITEKPADDLQEPEVPVSDNLSTMAPSHEVEATEKTAEGVQEPEAPGSDYLSTTAPADEVKLTKKPAEEVQESEVPVSDNLSTTAPVDENEITEKPAEEVQGLEGPVSDNLSTTAPVDENEITEKPAEEMHEPEAPVSDYLSTAAPEDNVEKTEKPSDEKQEPEAPVSIDLSTTAPVDEVDITDKPTNKVQEPEAPVDEVKLTEKPEEKLEASVSNNRTPAAPEDNVEITEKPADEVQEPEAPVSDNLSTAVPVDEVDITEKPTDKVQEPEAPISDHLSTINPQENVEITEKPADEPQEPEVPVSDNLSTIAPLHEVEATEKTVEEVQEPEAPISDHLSTTAPADEVKRTEKPAEEVQQSEVPVSDNLSTMAPLHEVEITEKPTEEMQEPEAPINDHLSTIVPDDANITQNPEVITKETETEPTINDKIEIETSTRRDGTGDIRTEIPDFVNQEFGTKYQTSTDIPKLVTQTYIEEKATTESPAVTKSETYEPVTYSEEQFTKDSEIKSPVQGDLTLQPTTTESVQDFTKTQDLEGHEEGEEITKVSDKISTISSVFKTTVAIETITKPAETITSQPDEDIESTPEQNKVETTTNAKIEDELSLIDRESTKTPFSFTDQQTVDGVTENQTIDTATSKQETATQSSEEDLPSRTYRPESSETTAEDLSEKPTDASVLEEQAAVSPVESTSIEPHVLDEELHTTFAADKISTPKIPAVEVQTEKVITPTEYQSESSSETSTPKEKTTMKFTTKAEEVTTLSPLIDRFTKPAPKPTEVPVTEQPRPIPTEEHPTDDIPNIDDEASVPPSGSSGYGQETDYVDEDPTFGPGTCRYGGKVYVSAQQIPRDDPCDFCFCFRSDIICLQQSCPPPIQGCHEEPIQGFCCPRYECPVSMATTVNVTTTTTTTTTTLPPHFPIHSYKGSAQKRGCLIKGHTYKVGEVVRASSGPCLHCTCGGDGQMKCDPKQCTPEPMLRQMIAAAVSAKRRR